MEFLYAYMPWADMANKSPEYFLENVRLSLRAREEMPWGKTVPEREFRHFVLPVRVNNEDLDYSRADFYARLRDRVKGLSMREAILEVNHWCHELVTYRPSDARTSPPLSSVSQAIGRCGEESTFTVAALRSVGIPARQVYTPRWAHTDDNHAWVEAWADGQWYFLGACEPEPILNMAWFNLPASRGMLMTTNAFGRYDGPEEQLGRTAVATTINVTRNYAPVSGKEVTVLNADSVPAPDADVLFMLYNYGEYYPVARKKTDVGGKASLVSGIGDMVVWATDGDCFGLTRLSPEADSHATVVLDFDGSHNGMLEFDIIPPKPSATLPSPDAARVAANELRKQHEDSIRNAYTATFATDSSARAFAASLGLDPDMTARVLVESRGNHNAIKRLLSESKPASRPLILSILNTVSEKDRRDITMEVLTDRLSIETSSDSPETLAYVLNPRVENEGLEPFAAAFLSDMDKAAIGRYRHNPAEWVAWVRDNIAPDNKWNPGRLRIHPAAVWRTRKADALSRRIFFVASARAMGIPSRIDPVTGKTQWLEGEKWRDATLDIDKTAETPGSGLATGEVVFTYTPQGRIDDPKYYTHYSISRIENGLPRLMEFDEEVTLSWLNSNYRDFDAGQYMLTTGQRMADGSVLTRSRFFTVTPGESVTVPVEIRQDTTGIQEIGNFNSENLYADASGGLHSILSATGRGYNTLIYGAPNHEPTAHVLNEISAMADDFETNGRKIVLLYADSDKLSRANPAASFNLPANVTTGYDPDGRILAELTENLKIREGDYPIVVVADTFNRVVYAVSGYTIGTAERLIDILSRLKE